MKTDPLLKNVFTLAPSLCVAFLVAGCQNIPLAQEGKLDSLNALEKEAIRYGSISVGAPRVYDYADSQQTRAGLVESINDIKNNLDKVLKPQIISLNVTGNASTFSFNPNLRLPGSSSGDAQGVQKPTTGQDQTSRDQQGTQNLTQSITSLLGDNQTAPDPIDLIRLKLSVLRFLESQKRDLELGLPDADFRRLEISVSVTAWVRDPARSALVYLDLYPFNGDEFCHELAEVPIPSLDDPVGFSKLEPELKDTYETSYLKGKPYQDFIQLSNKTPADRPAACHAWLTRNRLVPKLVYVESLGDSRYLGERSLFEAENRLGLGIGPLKAGSRSNSTELRNAQDIVVTTLSFAAGERRAGWYFFRHDETKGMRPIERRISMVVDVPKVLKKMELHVHKSFLDKNENPLLTADMQMQHIRDFRIFINTLEGAFPKEGASPCADLPSAKICFPDSTSWQLAKTAVRNLSQSFDQRLVIDLPTRRRGRSPVLIGTDENGR